MTVLNINETMVDDEARELYGHIIENEPHNIRGSKDDSYDVSLLSESGLYEVGYEYDDNVCCFIRRVA